MADCSLVAQAIVKKAVGVCGPWACPREYDYIIPMLAYISDILSEF